MSNNYITHYLLDSEELVSLGVAKSLEELQQWRENDKGPPYYAKMPREIYYDKDQLISWLNRRKIEK